MTKLEEILFLQNLNRAGKTTIYKKYWDTMQNSQSMDDLKNAVSADHSQQEIDNAAKEAEKTRKNVEAAEAEDISAITIFDEDYPANLRVMGQKAPLVLYAKGSISALHKTGVAVIGTRHPMSYSEKVEKNLVKKIIEIADPVIVSGLAIGCDAIAHQVTINMQKQTIAVLPSGVNVVTPSCHQKLAEQILENNGCLISEYTPDAKAYRASFVERDAIVAALSDLTFVVECDVRSGTMHTVDFAREYERPVACFYPIIQVSGTYMGNKYMMRKGAAKVSGTTELRKVLGTVEK